ncbi:transposase, partial [Streptomyces eurythermus]
GRAHGTGAAPDASPPAPTLPGRHTDAIESVNARIRRAVKARGRFPDEQAALRCVYMATMSLDPTGTGQARWTMRWKTARNAFDITFDGRLSAARQ